MKRVHRLLALFALFTLQHSFAAERPWTEIRSPHFRVLTNGNIPSAITAARELEQLRWLFSTRFPNARLESGAPLTVFATGDEATAKSLDPNVWKASGGRIAGFFSHGFEKQYALVRLDTFGGNGSKEVVYHEYTHTIMHLNTHWLPTWLDEGTAEFYAYTRFDENKIYLGAPTERVRSLNRRVPDPIEEIMSVRPGSRIYEPDFFYAESWALVHFLIYGPGMDKGKKLDNFVALLQQGVNQKNAFKQVFGDPKDIDKAFAAYTYLGHATAGDGAVGQMFAATVIKSPPQISEKDFTVRVTTAAETEAELGGFHLWTHDPAGARPLLEAALKDDPRCGLAHENMGFLDFDEGNDSQAESEFGQAYAIDSRLYLSLFAKTMLSPISTSQSVPDMNAFGATMGKVLQLNQQFAPAYVQLARLAIREGDLQSALILSRKAEEMEPSLAGYRLLSGQILHRMGKNAEAAAAAQFVADRWISADHNEAVELWNSIPSADRPNAEVKVEPAGKDALLVEGKVKSVSCGEKPQDWAAFVLDKDGNSMLFHHKTQYEGVGFSDTIWYGSDHFNPCHHLEGLRAIIYYHAPADATYAGDAIAVEIREDLPGPVNEADLQQK